MMELGEFIRETLTEIVKGVSSAQEEVKNKGAVIVPEGVYLSSANGTYQNQDRNRVGICQIDFEIALTQTDGKQGKIGIGVWFGSVGLGGQQKTDIQNISVNNVKFSVPIMLPQSKF